jgi:hypothetical protein
VFSAVKPNDLESIMELSSLFDAFGSGWIDELVVWAVALAVGVVGLVAVVSALNVFFEAEAG